MNAVLIKCKKGKEYRVPLEIVVLSDKPQRVHASASYISTHLSERLKELAALVPGKRWEYICDAAGKFHAALMDTPGKSNLLKEIGLELNDIPITVNARVLDPPVDTYSKDDETLAIPYQNPVEYVLVDFSKNNNDENDNVEENVNHLMERMREKFGISITNTQVFFKFKYNANANCGDENVLKDLETVVQWHTENKPKKAGRKLIYIVVIENAHKSTNLHGTEYLSS
uniref:Uncharacterized protein n=1 Tax=Panagrolaimus superbus TaxID=310955 RepID=A0A914Z936_9BILA